MTFDEWAMRHPDAAAELLGQVIADTTRPGGVLTNEAQVQAKVRLQIATAGALSWRNNVGATPSKCPDCGTPQRPIRYGLANDSAQLNRRVKSSDLILAIPRKIGPADVGRTIAQFGAVETKRPGWRYTGKGQEPGQAAWLALVERIGGFAAFSTGEVTL